MRRSGGNPVLWLPESFSGTGKDGGRDNGETGAADHEAGGVTGDISGETDEYQRQRIPEVPLFAEEQGDMAAKSGMGDGHYLY
jgi:hypothetical protein